MKLFWIALIGFFLELGCFVAFSEEFGFWMLVGEILLSGILGVLLLFNALSGTNESIIELLRGAKNPQEVLASNLTKVFGAILLIIPGLLSDCMGILLQFGILDSWVAMLLGKSTLKTNSNQEIIEAEIVQERIEDEKNHYRE